jgi:hypothetical protein
MFKKISLYGIFQNCFLIFNMNYSISSRTNIWIYLFKIHLIWHVQKNSMLPYRLIFLNITQHPDTSFHSYLVNLYTLYTRNRTDITLKYISFTVVRINNVPTKWQRDVISTIKIGVSKPKKRGVIKEQHKKNKIKMKKKKITLCSYLSYYQKYIFSASYSELMW